MDPRELEEPKAALNDRNFNRMVRKLAGTNNQGKMNAVRRAMYFILDNEDDEAGLDWIWDRLHGRKDESS